MSIKIHPQPKDKASEKMDRHRTAKDWPKAVNLAKPSWLRVRIPAGTNVAPVKNILKEHQLVTVCEEASCPNLPECFSKGTATFMIMGSKCTRRCSFCDVAHGRPDPLDPQEPFHVTQAIKEMRLKHVVITSVDRDDLLDGGAAHFASCIEQIRLACPDLVVEILVPDFRKRQEKALLELSRSLPDVFNHNLETIERLYRAVRPGSDYQCSLTLLKTFKERFPHIVTKSGMMLGLGETDEEVYQAMLDVRAHDCDGLTLGQYLQPSQKHFPLQRYVTPEEFLVFEKMAYEVGFSHVASGPLVRSSYHADEFLSS